MDKKPHRLTLRKALMIAVLPALLLGFTSAPASASVAVSGVSIDYQAARVGVGQTLQVRATVAPSSATDKSVTWSSSSVGVATVTASGLIRGVATGSTTITVTTVDGGKTATVPVSVVVPVTGISINRTTATISRGTTSAPFATTVAPSNATDATVLWSSSNTRVATITTAGSLTALSQGTTHLWARTRDGFFTAEADVTVVEPVVGISLSPSTMVVAPGESLDALATIIPASATDRSVTWITGNPDIATVSSSGRVSGVATGTTTITATTTDGPKVATMTVIVTTSVTSVTLDRHTVELATGTTHTLMASILPAAATMKRVTWSSSNDAVATVAIDGTVTGLSPGNATIAVTTVDGDFTDAAAVTVANSTPVTGISMDLDSTYIGVGGSIAVIATVAPAAATDQRVVWSSSVPEIAAVDDAGLVRGITAGRAIITARTIDGGFTAEAMITVGRVTDVTIDQQAFSMGMATSVQLTATVLPDDAPDRSLIWTSSSTSVAMVDQDGMVNGVGVGAATISARTNDGGFTSSIEITVTAVGIPVDGISLGQATLSLETGATVQLEAVVTPENASNRNINWSSSDPLVVSVDDGALRALRTGTSTITSTTSDGGFVATMFVTVNTTNAVTGVTLDRSAGVIGASSQTLSRTVQLLAVVAPVDASQKDVIWSSSDSAIATVDGGLVTAVSGGPSGRSTVAITATTVDGGFTARANFTVTTFAAPGAPTNVSGSSSSSSSTVDLVWAAPSLSEGDAVMSYRVEVATGDEPNWSTVVESSGTSARVATVTGLALGTSYRFRVSAFNGVEWGVPSAPSGIVTTASGSPQTPSITNVTPGTNKLTVVFTRLTATQAWNLPVTYRIFATTGSSTKFCTVSASSTATSCDVTALSAGIVYVVTITAETSNGTSVVGRSSASSVNRTPLVAMAVPSAPSSITATDLKTGTGGNGASVRLVWTAPTNIGGSAITGYKVERAVGGVWATLTTTSGSTLTFTNTGLNAATSYSFRVRAVNAIGQSSATTLTSAVTPTGRPGTVLLGAVTPGIGSLKVAFTRLSLAAGGGLSVTYTVTATSTGRPTKTCVVGAASTANSCTIGALTRGSVYVITIVASNSIGAGAISTSTASVANRTVK